MAKRKAAAARKPQRRPRAEIDRNYFLGDVFIKTGVAAALAIGLILAYAPGMMADALNEHKYAYPGIIGFFAVAGIVSFLIGSHLRREATQWDFD